MDSSPTSPSGLLVRFQPFNINTELSRYASESPPCSWLQSSLGRVVHSLAVRNDDLTCVLDAFCERGPLPVELRLEASLENGPEVRARDAAQPDEVTPEHDRFGRVSMHIEQARLFE